MNFSQSHINAKPMQVNVVALGLPLEVFKRGAMRPRTPQAMSVCQTIIHCNHHSLAHQTGGRQLLLHLCHQCYLGRRSLLKCGLPSFGLAANLTHNWHLFQ